MRVICAGESHVLLVQNETILAAGAVDHLLDCVERLKRYSSVPAVLVGATRCPQTGQVVTSGLNRQSPRSRTYDRVMPTLACMPVDTFDGNCLLVPEEMGQELAGKALTPAAGHRLRRKGYGIFLAPGFVGTCSLR